MRRGLLVLCLVLASGPVAAQTVNPSTLAFTASTDHATVQRYELRLYYVGAPQPFTAYDLGKPALNEAGEIILTNPSWFATAAAGLACIGRVAAINADGEGLSLPSNEWVRLVAPAKGQVWIVVTGT